MKSNFTINLAYIKKAKYFKNSDLADIIGMSAQNVGNLLKGKVLPTSETLITLSNEFGCTVDDLLKVDLSKQTTNSGFVGMTDEAKTSKHDRTTSPIEDILRKVIEIEVKNQLNVDKDKIDRLELLVQVDNELSDISTKKRS